MALAVTVVLVLPGELVEVEVRVIIGGVGIELLRGKKLGSIGVAPGGSVGKIP